MANALTAENIDKLAKQILAQNTTSKWTGGLDPQKSAMYMASDLAKSGITDISQVGKGEDGIGLKHRRRIYTEEKVKVVAAA